VRAEAGNSIVTMSPAYAEFSRDPSRRSVTADGRVTPLPDYPFSSAYRPGEIRSCIVVNAVGDSIVENITFDNVHLTFEGGGTAEEAARRDLPQVAGEYFMLGSLPAYGLYARNARAISLRNVRFQVSKPDLRPAVIFDHVEDAAINGLSVQGNAEAESLLRFIDSKQTLMTATRLLTPAAVFLQLEGPCPTRGSRSRAVIFPRPPARSRSRAARPSRR
jgi:hypothetical protein